MTARQLAILVLIAAASSLLYLPTVDLWYLSDDLRFFVKPLDWSDSGKVFLTEMRFIRPIWRLSMAMDQALWGTNPVGAHVLNMTLHGLNVLLVGRLAWRLTGRFATAAVAALLFGVHAAHVEPVAWLSGRVDPLCTLFVLASWTTFLTWREAGGRLRYFLALCLFALALGSKEPAACLPALLVGGEMLRGRAGRYLATLPFVALLVAYLAIRFVVFKGVGGYQTVDGESTLTLFSPRQLAEGVLFAPLRGLFAPVNVEYWSASSALYFQFALYGLLGLLVIAVLWSRTRPWTVPNLIAIALLYVPVAPAAMFLARGMDPNLMHSRILYLSSAGTSLLLADLVVRSMRGRVRVAFVSALALSHAVLLYGHQQPWRDASEIAQTIPAQINAMYPLFPVVKPIVIFDNVPDTTAGAYIYRNGLNQAMEILHPQRPQVRTSRASEGPFYPSKPAAFDRRFTFRWDGSTKTVSDLTEEVRALPADWADEALSFSWNGGALDSLRGSGAERLQEGSDLVLIPQGDADVIVMTPRMPLLARTVRVEIALDALGDATLAPAELEFRSARDDAGFTQIGQALPLVADGQYHVVEGTLVDLEEAGARAWKRVQLRVRARGAKVRLRSVRVMGLEYLRERLLPGPIAVVDAQGIHGDVERICNRNQPFDIVPRRPSGQPDTRSAELSLTLAVPAGADAIIASTQSRSGFRVEVSADGEHFESLGVLPDLVSLGLHPRVLSLPDPGAARFVRILAPPRGHSYLCEVGFLGAPAAAD